MSEKNIAIVFDSCTDNTAKAAGFIADGIASVPGVRAFCLHLDETHTAENIARLQTADALLLGSPTYMAAVTAKMATWLQQSAPKLNFAGKLGGAFATEQYIHGGAENVLSSILTAELVLGMLAYSGGNAYGKPVIHLGPVGMSPDIERFRQLFHTYGQRFATRLKQLG